MAKQIKIGFDKTPAPVTKVFQQLIDVDGTLLFDDAGNPLVTEDDAVATGTLLSANALSVHVNNSMDPGGGGAIAIEEQFKEFSEVSSSLLGVQRAEEQLSLFSDVATYGLDEDNWDASDFFTGTNQSPYEWYNKEHPVYGRRSSVRFYEGSDEQALYIKGFPTQYSYPAGPKELNRNEPDSSYMIAYMNFIAVGRYLYDFWVAEGQEQFAKTHFISREDASVINDLDEIVSDDLQISTTGSTLTWSGTGMLNPFDVKYSRSNIQDSFDAIERWTVAYDKIKDRLPFPFPRVTSQTEELEVNRVDETRGEEIRRQGYPAFGEFFLIRAFLADTEATRPGRSSLVEYYGVLQSKRTFRYQPGRVSGFTFGTRVVAGDKNRQDQTAEWGCANDTDMYMFQLKGSTFNIVRRSTKKMPDDLLTRQGLTPPENYQSNNPRENPVRIKGIGKTEELWETIIPRNKFNGDSLDGNGPSGYILTGFEDVTMYKIEFSWYGAIGAKFYAYVPIGVGECRWVLMHTFVIENGLGEPILENPDFRFRYLVHTANTENIRAPMFLYKYGSSCYIDGGDEGTLRLSTVSADTKQFNTRTPILGILPKENIKNTVGTPKINQKKSYPSTLSVTSDKSCRLDFEEILGSPQGVHFNYSPTIRMNGRNPKSRTLKLQYSTGGNLTGNSAIIPVQPARTSSTLGFNDFLAGGTYTEHGFKVDANNSVLTIASSITAPDNFQADDMYEGNPITGSLSISATGEITITNDIKVYSAVPDGSYVRVSGVNSGTANLQAGNYRVSNPGNSTTSFTLRTLNGTASGGALGVSGTTIDGMTISLLREFPTSFDSLQVGDSLRIGATDYVIKYFGNNQSSSTGETELTLETSTGVNVANQRANLIYKYNPSDKNAHIIANGVYGRYVDSETSNLLQRRGGANEDAYDLVDSQAVESATGILNSSDFRSATLSTTDESGIFDAVLSSYHTVVASDVPIRSNKFKIHFLNPDAKDPGSNFGLKHFAEFLVGVTPHKPIGPDDSTRNLDEDPEVKFNKYGQLVQFDRDEFPTIEYAHHGTRFNARTRLVEREADDSYGNRLNIDPRLNLSSNTPKSHAGEVNASGDASTVECNVDVNTYAVESIDRDVLDPVSGSNRIKIVFADSAPSVTEIVPDVSEVGFNFAALNSGVGNTGGSTVKFQSQVVYPPVGSDAKPYVFIDNDSAGDSSTGHFDTLTNGVAEVVIQTKTITIKDDWRATTFASATATEDERERFQHKSFKISKAVSFNTQPLYPVFALADFSRINCVVIEEISETGEVRTHTPNFLTEDDSWNTSISIVQPQSSANNKTPSAFNAIKSDLNSACRYDFSTLNPLRPGNVIYSIFVDANDTTTVELDNVFARDRKGIQRGALNNKGVFITATSIDSALGNGNIQVSLTSKEQ